MRKLMLLVLPMILVMSGAIALAEDKKTEKVPEGFTSLFNGEDLKGWKVHGGKEKSWGTKEGMLFVSKGGGGWLMTEKEFGDFELRLQFKLSPGANSGVALRAPMKGDPAYTGMEIQILDDKHPSYKGLQSWQHTGSIYDVVAAAKIVNKPVGEWNSYVITCKGSKVKVVLNDEVLVDADLADYYEKKAEKHPGIKREKGHIGFQEHGGIVEFRNIWIKEL
jgi:hypothetical protein